MWTSAHRPRDPTPSCGQPTPQPNTLGVTREVDAPAPYEAAFARIDTDPYHLLPRGHEAPAALMR